jgi:hypothetical protein
MHQVGFITRIITSIKPNVSCEVLLHPLRMEVIHVYMEIQIFSVTETGPAYPRTCIVPNIWLRGHLMGSIAKVKTQKSTASVSV